MIKHAELVTVMLYSYADDVNNSTSYDSGMILDLTPGQGNKLMGGLVINVPDDDGTTASDRNVRYPHIDSFHQGHERRPPNDRYDNLLNRGQEYPSPIDGKRGWNDFCTGGVAHYPRKDGFHQGHEHLPRKDRHNTLNRGQNILCQLMGRGDRMTFAPAKLHVIPTMRLPFRS